MLLAYWIYERNAEIIVEKFSEGTHIQHLWNNLNDFPIDRDTIIEIFKIYHEPLPSDNSLPVDGKAAHKILTMMYKKKFMTSRYHESTKTLHLNLWKITNETIDILTSFFMHTGLPAKTIVIINQFHKNISFPISKQFYLEASKRNKLKSDIIKIFNETMC